MINLALKGKVTTGDPFTALSNVKRAAAKDIYLKAADIWIKKNLPKNWKSQIIDEIK